MEKSLSPITASYYMIPILTKSFFFIVIYGTFLLLASVENRCKSEGYLELSETSTMKLFPEDS